MAISADKVIVELEAKLDRYNTRITGAERHFDRSMRNIQGVAGRTEARVAGAFRNMAAAAGITIGTAGVILAARGFLRYADAAKNVEAQLRLATRESGSFAKAQEDVRRVASLTRTGLEETATLYATFQRNARELGITQEQAARATQTVSQAFLISGASAAEASGGLRQFLQGVQSGTLRGEELNSVLENAPRLARLLADSLNVTIGQLRAMGQEGELTGQKLITALTDRRFTDQIDEEFRELPVTFDQAMTLVNNAAIVTFGAFDRGGQFSNAIANFIVQTTGGMGEIEDAAVETGVSVRATFAGLYDAFEPLVSGALEAFGIIGAQAMSLRDTIAGVMGALDTVVNESVAAFDGAASGLRRLVVGSGGGTVIAPFVSPVLNRFLPDATPIGPQSNLRGRFERGYDRSARRLRMRQAARELFGSDGGGTGSGRRPPAAAGGGRKRRGRRGEDPEAIARREAADEQRFQNELAQLNEDLLAARQSMVTAADAIAAYEVQQINAARDRQNAAYQAQVEQTRGDRGVAQARADQLVAANNAVAAERVRAVGLREQQRIDEERVQLASSDLDNAIELEQAQGALAVTTDARRESALRLLGYQQEQERLELEGIVALRGINDARGREAQNRLDMLDTLYQARRQGVMNDNESPRARYLRELETGAANINERLEEIEVLGIRGLGDDLATAAKNALGLEGALGNVVEQLIRMVIETQLLLPLMRALSAGGGIGGFLGSLGIGGGSATSSSWADVVSAVGSLPGRASGGPVQAGKPYWVGEHGKAELFVPGQSGTIIPQGKALSPVGGQAMSPGSAAPVARVQLMLSGDIEARIESVSAGVAVEVVRAAAPHIMAGAKAETLRTANRPRLNRG